MRVWILTVAMMLVFPGLVGCVDKRLEAQLEDLRSQVAEMNRRLTDAHVRIEEMSNRMFLIQEQLSSATPGEGASASRRLPVVKLVPGARGEEEGQAAMGDAQMLTSAGNHVTNQPDSGEAPILISNWPTAPVSPPPAGALRRPEASAEKTAYDEALATLKGGDSNGAITAFAAFLRRYPESRYAGNAIFWTGVAHVEQQEYALALDEFERVISERHTHKAADALYYKGLCLMRSGRHEAAVSTWRKLISRFPDHEAATRARQELNAPSASPNL